MGGIFLIVHRLGGCRHVGLLDVVMRDCLLSACTLIGGCPKRLSQFVRQAQNSSKVVLPCRAHSPNNVGKAQLFTISPVIFCHDGQNSAVLHLPK
jgi:hypothetical protein